MSGGDVDFSRGAYNACQRGDATKQQQQSAACQIILLHAEIGRLKTLAEWRPIETAPKDGRGVIVIDMAAEAPEPGMGYWACDVWSCVDPSPAEGADRATIQAITWQQPTHWMPLPETPAPVSGDIS